jgi:hypothetical protein
VSCESKARKSGPLIRIRIFPFFLPLPFSGLLGGQRGQESTHLSFTPSVTCPVPSLGGQERRGHCPGPASADKRCNTTGLEHPPRTLAPWHPGPQQPGQGSRFNCFGEFRNPALAVQVQSIHIIATPSRRIDYHHFRFVTYQAWSPFGRSLQSFVFILAQVIRLSNIEVVLHDIHKNTTPSPNL